VMMVKGALPGRRREAFDGGYGGVASGRKWRTSGLAKLRH
jgi:hypothetical protein